MSLKVKIKFVLICLISIVSVLFFNSCGCHTVPAGYVGIKVYLLGTDKGVDHEEKSVGRYWLGFNEEMYLFPTFMQNYVWTENENEGSPNDESITFQSIEGLTFSGDFGISYYINPKMVSAVFQKYRRGVEEITDIYMRNQFRDALNNCASMMTADSIYGRGKKALIDAVTEQVQLQNDSLGIIIEKFYAIGKFRLPEQVEKALNLKIEALQRAQQRENEVAEAEAQARKTKAEAEGTRAKQELENRTLTPQILQKMWIEKWDGRVSLYNGNSDNMQILVIPESMKK